MTYHAELTFLQKFLKNIHLNYHMIAQDAELLPPFDLGLRTLLSLEREYETILELIRQKPAANTLYKVIDPFFCRYIFWLLPDFTPAAAMLIGPYTTSIVSEQTVTDFMEARAFPIQLLPQMVEYYSRVPILWEDEPLFAALEVLAEQMWGTKDSYRIQTLEYLRPDLLPPLSSHYSSLLQERYDMERLERRYQLENRLLSAVSHGQTQEAEALLSPFSWQAIEPRTADSIRNLKNYLVILNTLMRKAVERGAVHPLHIDRLSGYFAHKIELLSYPGDLPRLVQEMTHKYCLLVKNHSLKTYSQPVRKVITNIDYDLTADLSLSAQAQLLNVNPSYLSTLFKKETGATLTDYVNQKRVEHAVFLLNSTSLQVQAIAQQCGIPDVNYFSKTFKKHMGQTPMEYRKSISLP